MTFLIPAGLLIIGLLCCIGIAFLVVQARTDERKAVAQKALVTAQKTSPRPATPTTTVIPATPVPSTPLTSSSTPSVPSASSEPLTSPTSSATSTNESVDDDATVRKHYSKEVSAHMGEETTNLPTTEPIGEQQEGQEQQEAQNGNGNGKSHGNGQNGNGELQNLQLYTEMEQIVELFQDGKLSPEWMHEQIQELSVKVQDLHQQSSLVERHIALLNQIAMYMNELEQVRHEYKVLREKRGAVLRIPTRLHGEDADGDTYIQTDKRPAMRKYTLKTM